MRDDLIMARVISNLAMSVDGFVAYPDDSVGELFDWYFDGPVEVEMYGGLTMRMSETSAAVFREALDAVGAFLVGRRLYDITNGWNARPPAEAPMVVLTHDPPGDWPRDGVPITFATTVEDAVAEAKALAGDRVVSVAGAATARACLDAGLLDEVYVNLVPVAIGAGVPFLAGIAGSVRFEDPEVIEAPGVTHLRYRVKK
jgi:dihydrofolate reductase